MKRSSLWIGFLIAMAGCSPSVHDAAGRGDLSYLKRRIESDAGSVDARNSLEKTPLHYAVFYKQLATMELLVSAGADIDAQDVTGMTPLHVAAMYGRKEEATWLLAQGARVDMRDRFGDTPLHTAAVFGSGGVVKLFLDQGLRLDDTNDADATPLALARKHRHDKLVEYFERLARS